MLIMAVWGDDGIVPLHKKLPEMVFGGADLLEEEEHEKRNTETLSILEISIERKWRDRESRTRTIHHPHSRRES